MSDRLTYKKIYVDSAYRLSESNSTSDFIIELDQNSADPFSSKGEAHGKGGYSTSPRWVGK